MNKIEDILQTLLKESPDLIEQKDTIRKFLQSMEENNPNITIDRDFKKALKNKLETTAYAKIKNTLNKKVNIAEKGTLSFRKDAKSIFEKPKFNFLKLLIPIFAGSFAMFGFFHFFGGNLFSIQKGGELEYNNIQVGEQSNTIGVQNLEDLDKNNLKEEVKIIESNTLEAEAIKTSDEDFSSEASLPVEKKSEIKESIQEKIKNKINARNTQKQINDISEEKIEITVEKSNKSFQKNKSTEESPVSFDNEESSITNDMSEPNSILQSDQGFSEVESIKKNQDINGKPTPVENNTATENTEIIDILGDEGMLDPSTSTNTSSFQGTSSEGIIDEAESDSIDDSSILIPGILSNIDEVSKFELYCEEKGGIIAGNMCTYAEGICSKENFIKNGCEK